MLFAAAQPRAVACRFIDRINSGDAAGLLEMMADDHVGVLSNTPVRGRIAAAQAWLEQFAARPGYLIHPHRLAVTADEAVIVGHVSAANDDEDEIARTVIWVAAVRAGKVAGFRQVEDSRDNRRLYGLN